MKRFLTALGLTLFGLTIVVPLVWVLISSLKSGAEIFSTPWSLPSGFAIQNYENAWKKEGIGPSFLNTLFVTLATMAILIPVGSMAAYIFAKYPFRGSKILFGAFLGGMMFPNFLIVIPLYFLLKSLSLYDTHTGLIIAYVAYSLSFTIFVLTGFFQALPNELAEASELDGCGHFGTFWRVMLPLARPGLIVVGIFNAIGLWNEYPLAKVLLNSSEKRTLPLTIVDMATNQQYSSDWGALFAGLVIVMLPVMIVYWFFRDRIHETMLAGAVKG
ncbi:MAG: carbohydrate ABC transporter permease [Fimbriimonadaceae bacterium]|nr:carbohydrate ABC transporter permease [Fimbriimonadaceae bacterium]